MIAIMIPIIAIGNTITYELSNSSCFCSLESSRFLIVFSKAVILCSSFELSSITSVKAKSADWGNSMYDLSAIGGGCIDKLTGVSKIFPIRFAWKYPETVGVMKA